jgi:hypothetical protein
MTVWEYFVKACRIDVEELKKQKNRGCFMGSYCSKSNDDISEADISSIIAMVDVIDTSIDFILQVPQNPKANSIYLNYSRFSTCLVFCLSNTNGTSPLNALQ